MALVLRVGWGLSRPTSNQALAELPDQVEYLSLARNVLSGQGLSFVDPRFQSRVYAFRMPGYPLFLAACGASVPVARAAQAILDTSTLLAVYLLARTLLPANRRAAELAALAVALNPCLVYFSGLILSETLFIALTTWGMALIAGGLKPQGQTTWRWWAGGGLTALAVLVRPSAGALPLLLGIGAVALNRPVDAPYHSSPRRRRSIVAVVLLTSLVGLTLFPWALRNARVLHRWIWTDTNAGITLYDGYNPAATGASDQAFVRQMPELARMDEVERSDYLSGRARKFIDSHRARAIGLIGAKIARTWSPIPLSEQFSRPLYRLALLSYALPFDLLVIWGIVGTRLPRAGKVFLLLPAIYLTVVHALTIGSLRYRLPAEPALAVLAGAALAGPKRASED